MEHVAHSSSPAPLELELPLEHAKQFENACKLKGLQADSFDPGREPSTDTQHLLRVVLHVGKKSFSYAVSEHDFSWIERFFADLDTLGDPGDGVSLVFSDRERAQMNDPTRRTKESVSS